MSPTLSFLAERPVTGPSDALSLVGEVLAAAVAIRALQVHPSDLAVEDGRVILGSLSTTAGSPLSAPEFARTGPNAATLVFSAALVGVTATLGDVEPAPRDRIRHQHWLEDLVARLFDGWGEGADAWFALDWLGRCLAYDSVVRPSPRQVLDALPSGDAPPPIPDAHAEPQPAALTPAPLQPVVVASASTSAAGMVHLPPVPPELRVPLLLAAATAFVSLALAACSCGAVLQQLFLAH